MKSFNLIALCGLAVLLTFGVAPQAEAQGSTSVLQVLAIDTDGDTPGLLAVVKRADAINDRLGVERTARVWQASLAGEQANSVVVAIEYPSLVALAQSQAKQQADPEWQKLIQDAQKFGFTSNSVWNDITP